PAIIDPDRVVVVRKKGCNCVRFGSYRKARVGMVKRYSQLEYISEEHLLVARQRVNRDTYGLGSRIAHSMATTPEWIKVAESKGCSTLTSVLFCKLRLTFCLCV
ncbi:hypothetical protein FQR65_LT19315, partial [Abscondita terminalis]